MEIALSIIGIFIAIATFYYSFYRRPTPELNNLKALYRATQRLSLSVQQDIEEYANRTNSWDNLMFEGITFRTYLSQMKNSYNENLSNKLFDSLTELKLSRPNIKSMTSSLETQQSSLLQMHSKVKMKLHQLDNS